MTDNRDADLDDDALMRAFALGDACAFEQLYARHHAALYRFVRRVLGREAGTQADEVFQDTWLRVVNARARWSPQGATFRTWLTRWRTTVRSTSCARVGARSHWMRRLTTTMRASPGSRRAMRLHGRPGRRRRILRL